MTRRMALVTRVACDKEGDGGGYRSDGDEGDKKGGEENNLKYSYLQVTVCMSPCRLRSGEG